MENMKYFQLIGLILGVAVFVGCETTQTAGQGNQERKRLAAIEQEKQAAANTDEAEQNLWSAQEARMNRESNPAVNPVHP
jgi:hypothetical protein